MSAPKRVRNVCSVDKFLLAAQAHNDRLKKQLEEIVWIDIVQGQHDEKFMRAVREAAETTALIVVDLANLDKTFKAVCR